jgi:two-component system sensor histidine kinase BarA
MRTGIRARPLLAALMAPILVLLAMAGYLLPSHAARLESALAAKGRLVVETLAVSAASPLRRSAEDELQALARTALLDSAVRRIRFTDGSGDGLLSVSEKPSEPTSLKVRIARILLSTNPPPTFRAPIYAQDPHTADAAPVAWVSAELSLEAVLASEAGFWAQIVLIVLLSGAAATGFALYEAGLVRRAMRSLAATVREFGQGRLDARVEEDTGAEIGELAIELNQMGRALQRSKLDLQRKVDQITGELRQTLEAVEVQNVELDLARQRALEGSKVKSAFLANMSHEIRTPINGILGFADLLSHTDLDDEQRDYVNTVKESCASLLAIVNDILDFSKIEAGKMVIDNVAFDLRDCVEEVLALLAPAAYGKSLDLVHLIYADVPLKLYGDPIRIRQVLTNLAHNAIKFTPSGRVVVRVMLEDETEQDAVLRINVTDTGIGLSQADQEKLFRAFGQADTSITRRFGGAGLGLIISRKLVEQMGGTLGLESVPGRGATFWFTLRCVKQRVIQADAEQRNLALAGHRILMYDEEPLSRLALRHTLEAWGCEVIEASERQSFIAQASAERSWELAVVAISRADLNARVFHGLMPRLRHVNRPIVALASTVDRNELRGLYQQGARATLPKAVRRQTLYRELCRLLAPEPAAALTVPPEAELAMPGRAVSQLKILVVDDNHINRKLVTTILSNYGIQALEAQDGREAVEIARERELDLIFMDIHMPTMSGETATRQIHALIGKDSAPVIVALTANAMPGERERLLTAGMDDCLIKPITEQQVSRILTSLAQSESVAPIASTGDTGSDNGAIADELRELLVTELPEHKRKIQRAFRGNRLAELKDHVHTLHGAASVCRLAELKAACAALENALRQDDLVSVPGGVRQLMSEVNGLLGDKAATT